MGAPLGARAARRWGEAVVVKGDWHSSPNPNSQQHTHTPSGGVAAGRALVDVKGLPPCVVAASLGPVPAEGRARDEER